MKACKPALESSYITKVIHDCKRDSEVSQNSWLLYVFQITCSHIFCLSLAIFPIVQALYFQFGIKLHNVVDSQVSLINITTLFLDKFAASIYCHMLSWCIGSLELLNIPLS